MYRATESIGSSGSTSMNPATLNAEQIHKSDSLRVLLADDEGMVRDAISAYLANQGGACVISVEDSESALNVLRSDGPFDLVLLDYDMPGMNGLDGLKQVKNIHADQKVAIFSGNAPKWVVQDALKAGASGFLPKRMTADTLVNAVRIMVSGESYFPIETFNTSTGDPMLPPEKQLSLREKQALKGLCEGLTNKEIARELSIEEVTVKLHIRTLCRKLEAKNRTHAAIIAKEANLI